MNKILFTIVFLSLIFCGCEQERIARLESEMAGMRLTNELLRKEYQDKLQELQAGIRTVEELKKDWQRFDQAYTPETRKELYANVDASRDTLAKIRELHVGSQQMLEQIRKFDQESHTLKETIAQYEKEARKDNVIKQLRLEREEMIAKAQQATESARSASLCVEQIRDTAETTRRSAESAEEKWKSAEQIAKKANEDSAQAKLFSQRMEDAEKKLAQLYRELASLERRIETSTHK